VRLLGILKRLVGIEDVELRENDRSADRETEREQAHEVPIAIGETVRPR
jgi:hypothetical protein